MRGVVIMDVSNKLRVLSEYNRYFDAIPLVEKGSLPLKEERAKMRLVAFIVGRNNGVDEGVVLKKMCEIRDLDMNLIPPLYKAAQETGVSMDYLMDYSKIQMLYEQGAILKFENFLKGF